LFILVAVILILLLFGSNHLPGVGKQLGKQARKPYRQAKWMFALLSGTEEESLRAEEEFGQECAREFLKQFSGIASVQDRELVSTIGARLVKAVKNPQRSFHFSAVVSSTANAFALPGGYIFITTRLLDLVDRHLDEIAFFLGHEIAHVVCGHAKDQMSAGTILNAIATRFAGAGGLLLQVLVKGYSRSMELEADKEGVRLAAVGGFNSKSSLQALRRLVDVSPDISVLAEYFSSHPTVQDRIKALE
jgi:beta-barrel assembly-enhancing protease